MRLWERLKSAVLPSKERVTGHVLSVPEGIPTYPKDSYLDLAVGGYSKNELVYAAINEIATSAPEAPLHVFTKGNQIQHEHRTRQLISRPNPFATEFEFWEQTIVQLYLSGNAFWEKVRSKSGLVVELWLMRPDRIKILPSRKNFVSGYLYSLGKEEHLLAPEDVIHFKLPNPTDDFFGMSPLKAALRQISMDNEATDFSKVIMQNRAVPGVVVTTEERIDEDTAQRLRAKWKRAFGSNNRGDVSFLQQGMDVKVISMNMQELGFLDLRNISETRILSVLGVPPILVGSHSGLQRSTFSNMQEARKSFWQETIAPLQRRLLSRLNADPDLNPGKGSRLEFDLSSVSALADITESRWERANRAFSAGWLSINEARSMVGLPNNTKISEPLRGKSREAVADRHYQSLLRSVKSELGYQETEVLLILNRYQKERGQQKSDNIEAQVAQVASKWVSRIQADFMSPLRRTLEDGHKDALSELRISPPLSNQIEEDLLTAQLVRLSKQISDTSQSQILDIVRNGSSIPEMKKQIMSLFSSWKGYRAERIARTETIRAANQGALSAYRQNGIERVRWLTATDCCSDCQSLNHETVTTGSTFLGDINSPPRHPNCRCTLVPVTD